MLTALLIAQALTLLLVSTLAFRLRNADAPRTSPDRGGPELSDAAASLLDAVRRIEEAAGDLRSAAGVPQVPDDSVAETWERMKADLSVLVIDGVGRAEQAVRDLVDREDAARASVAEAIERARTEITELVTGRAEQTEQVIREYLDEESTRDWGKEWVEAVAGLPEGEEIDILEAGASRHPGSVSLVNRLLAVYGPLAQDDDIAVRRHAVLRMNEHLDRFRRTCRREHLPYVKKARAEVDRLAEVIVGKANAEYQRELQAQLEALERGIKRVVRDPGADLEEVAELDRAVDQDGLRRFPPLKGRYDRASEQLIKALRERDASSTGGDVAYNERAMAAAKRAWARFHKNEESGVMGAFKDKDFNERKELERMVSDLGGWDSRRLLPATNTYVTSVYSEVFQKLKPGGRATLTELMIKAPTKK